MCAALKSIVPITLLFNPFWISSLDEYFATNRPRRSFRQYITNIIRFDLQQSLPVSIDTIIWQQ
jgi:hypothetical protein